VYGTGPDHHEQARIAPLQYRPHDLSDLNTVSAARVVSGSRRLTSSGVASSSLDATLTFCS